MSLYEKLVAAFPGVKTCTLAELYASHMTNEKKYIFVNETLLPDYRNITRLLPYLKLIKKNSSNNLSVWIENIQGKKQLVLANINSAKIKSKLTSKKLIALVNDVIGKNESHFDKKIVLLSAMHELLTLGLDGLSEEILHFYQANRKHYRQHTRSTKPTKPKVKNCWVGKGVAMDPSIRLDTSSGPIVIGENTKVGAFTYLAGPLWIGKNTFINHHSQVKGSVLGNTVKIGGEVSASIVGDYTNKVHYGFLGNSFVGEWVNMGAGTTISNLKNNYRTVSYINHLGRKIDSEELFMGAMVADFVRTGINTSVSPGIVLGTGASVRGQIDGNISAYRIYGSEMNLLNKARNQNSKASPYLKLPSLKATLELVFKRRNFIPESKFWNKLATHFKKSVK